MTALTFDSPPRLLADENIEPAIIDGLRLKHPQVAILTAAEAGILGMPDPALLALASERDRILVSHDLRTMPGHFSDFLMAGNHSTGVLLLPSSLSFGEAIESLLLVVGASAHHEWRDRIAQLPL